MTRDEAVAIKMRSHKVCAALDDYWNDEQVKVIAAAEVDELVALGLLKLDAPLTDTERLCAALNWGEHSSRIFNETLTECGLKVVRA